MVQESTSGVDFAAAFREGIKAAKASDVRMVVTKPVFSELARQISESTDGRVELVIWPQESGHGRDFNLIARSGKRTVFLAAWEDGMRCALGRLTVVGNSSHPSYCEDEGDLTNALQAMLRLPQVGAIFHLLLDGKQEEARLHNG